MIIDGSDMNNFSHKTTDTIQCDNTPFSWQLCNRNYQIYVAFTCGNHILITFLYSSLIFSFNFVIDINGYRGVTDLCSASGFGSRSSELKKGLGGSQPSNDARTIPQSTPIKYGFIVHITSLKQRYVFIYDCRTLQ